MLALLAGATHEVVWALPGGPDWEETGKATTLVVFRRLSDADSIAISQAASGKGGPADTRSRGSAPRSSGGSRATT